jgi:putative sterol carrier protein
MVDKFPNIPNGETQKPEDFVSDVPDCILTLDSRSLQEIASGNLNPQLAMLAGKIRVEGKSNLAVYLFNLIAPRERA